MKNEFRIKELILPFFIAILIFILCYYAKKTLFAFILSIAFSYLLNPVVRFFEVRGIKRAYTVATIYATIGLMVSFLILIVVNLASIDINSFVNNWPVYYSKFENIFASMINKMIAVFPFLSEFKINEKMLNFMIFLPQYLISFIPSLLLLFIIPFISFFILIKGDRLLEIISDNVPSRYVEIIYHITTRIDSSLGSYLRGIITEAFILFILAFFGLFFIGIDYFSIIAAIVGLSSIVPYLGAFMGAFLSSIIAYLQYNNIYYVVKVIIFFVLIRFIDDWFLQPYIMKKSVNLSPAIVVISLMAGAEISGFWGVVFAVPTVCIIREIVTIAMEIQRTEFGWKPQPQATKVSIPYT